MREMHKWKDKVEFSLDNRQIFFLFFGLSVLGCFVFVLGVMAGKRVAWEPDGRVASLATADSLDMLEDELADDGFEFREGLAASDLEEIPPTGGPAEPPRTTEEIEAAAKLAELEDDADEIGLDSEDIQLASAAPEPMPIAAAIPLEPPAREVAKASKATTSKPKVKAKAKARRQFTLQLKAFSQMEDAEKLAGQMRSNGHSMRVDSADVKGRTWHRVRLGTCTSWNEAVTAKSAFEKKENIIAYVMAM